MLSFLKSATASIVSNVQHAAAQPIQIGDRTVMVKEQLGEGGFAYVALVTDTSTGQEMAMKRMLCQDRESREIAETEIAVLKQLKGHPHIVGYIGSARRDNTQSSMKAVEYFILMELCTRGSLIDLIKRRNGLKLGELQVADLFTQICKGVSHMHGQKPPICHRDLKIENVLINARGELRICDFGSSTTRAQAYVTQREIVEEEERIGKYSTAMYRAPEMVSLASAIGQRTLINEKTDVWALGCILYTLAFFTQPFQEGGNLQILSGNYEVPEGHPFSKYLTALIKRLLTVDPTKRPDITQTLALCEQWHAWLKGGGVAKPANSRSVSSQDSAGANKVPQPSHAVTDPERLHRHHSAGAEASATGSAAAAAAAAKEAKRARKERKARAAAAASSAAAAPADDDWADFGSFPAAAPAPSPSPSSASASSSARAAPRRSPASPAKPGHSSASSDSSSDDDEPAPRLAKKSSHSHVKSPQSASASSASSRPPAASRSPPPPATATLFDTSFFAPAPVPSKPTAAAASSSSSSWEASFDAAPSSSSGDADWAAFGSGSSSSSAASSKAAAPAPAPSPLSFDDFDFSGFAAAASPSSAASAAAASASSPKSPHSASRRSRHGDKKDEAIDVSRLTLSTSKPKQRG